MCRRIDKLATLRFRKDADAPALTSLFGHLFVVTTFHCFHNAEVEGIGPLMCGRRYQISLRYANITRLYFTVRKVRLIKCDPEPGCRPTRQSQYSRPEAHAAADSWHTLGLAIQHPAHNG